MASYLFIMTHILFVSFVTAHQRRNRSSSRCQSAELRDCGDCIERAVLGDIERPATGHYFWHALYARGAHAATSCQTGHWMEPQLLASPQLRLFAPVAESRTIRAAAVSAARRPHPEGDRLGARESLGNGNGAARDARRAAARSAQRQLLDRRMCAAERRPQFSGDRSSRGSRLCTESARADPPEMSGSERHAATFRVVDVDERQRPLSPAPAPRRRALVPQAPSAAERLPLSRAMPRAHTVHVNELQRRECTRQRRNW